MSLDGALMGLLIALGAIATIGLAISFIVWFWQGSWNKRRERLPALSVLTLLLAVPLALFYVGKSEDPRVSACRRAPVTAAAEAEAEPGKPAQKRNRPKKNPKTPGALDLMEGERTTLAFGRDLDTRRLDVRFEISDGKIRNSAKPLRVVASDFRRDGEDDGAQLAAKRIHARARVINNRFVRLRVCVERGDPQQLGVSTESAEPAGDSAKEESVPPAPHPGSYSGDITFTDKRVNEMTVPLTIKFSYPRWHYIALLLYAVLIAGSLYVWALRGRDDEDSLRLSAETLKHWGQWSLSWSGLVGIVGGTAAAITAFTATYLASPDWGSGTTQILSLVGAMFTAFVTAGSALARGGWRKIAEEEPQDSSGLPEDQETAPAPESATTPDAPEEPDVPVADADVVPDSAVTPDSPEDQDTSAQEEG